MTADEVREFVREIMEEQALVIGGLVVVHDVEDDLIWRLIKCLDAIRIKAFRKLGELTPSDETLNLDPHPAIEEFLLNLRRSRSTAPGAS